MTPKETLGIYVPDKKTFYYLETGTIRGINVIDRLRGILLSKNITEWKPQSESDQNGKMMSLHDAEEKQYKTERLFLNAHIQASFVETSVPKKVGWGKK